MIAALAPDRPAFGDGALPRFGKAAPRVALGVFRPPAGAAPVDTGYRPRSSALARSRWYTVVATVACWVGAVLLGAGLHDGVDRARRGPAVPASARARAQAIAPLALGSRTGSRPASSRLVVPMAVAPERERVTMTLTAAVEELAATLVRAGAAPGDAHTAQALVADQTGRDGLAAGTPMTVTLGRRAMASAPRPIERLEVRARFALALTVERQGGRLASHTHPMAVDTTPLRIHAAVGPSLYMAARAAGAPSGAVVDYIKAIAARYSFGRDIAPTDSFDMLIEREHAATGEVRFGRLLFLALDRPGERTELVRWTENGQDGWFDADGRFEQRGALGMPVAGRITSPFGMRFHPLLGFSRMHKGIDIGAPAGTPVTAVVAGTVASAGWSGGYGNFIRLAHAPAFATGYGHLSRIAVSPGQRVARGEVICYVGSTGLSTGPHLHWEVWRNGQAVDPLTLSLDHVATLDEEQMRAFRARVAGLRRWLAGPGPAKP